MAKGRASRQSVDQQLVGWAQSLPDAQLLCRDIGHAWKSWRAWWDAEAHAYQRSLRCIRCKSERQQTLSDSGHSLSAHYVYAEGYLAPKGSGTLGVAERDLLRLESIVRLVDEAEPKRKAS